MNKISEYLSIKKAAEMVGVTPATLRNWERDGKIAVYRNPKNGYRLYKVADLETILLSIRYSKKEEVI